MMKESGRRLIVIPFKATIAKRNDIKNYAQYLTEKAGPGSLCSGSLKAHSEPFSKITD
ncbi:hypothetical protein [Limosilactobacillus reuteri]